MAFWQTNTGFQVWMGNKPFSTWFNAGFSSPLPTNTWWNTVKTTQKRDTYTYNPRYPWFDEEDYKKLEKMVTDKGITWSQKTEIMDQLYEIYYPQVLNKHKLDERQVEINNSIHQNGELLLNGNEEANMWIKLTSLSQQAKQKFWIPYDTPDNEVIDAMVKWVPNWSKLLYDYVNGKNQDLLYEAGLKTKVVEEKPVDTTQWWIKWRIADAWSNTEKWKWLPNAWELVNPLWYITEVLDNWWQWVADKITVWTRERKNLVNKINKLSDEDLAQYKKRYENSWYEGSFQDYIIDMNKTRWQDLVGADEELKEIAEPNVFKFFGNMPASTLRLITASLKNATNPYDVGKWIGKMLSTKEWREALYNRYLTAEWWANAMNYDSVGTADEILSVTNTIWNIGSSIGKATWIKSLQNNPLTKIWSPFDVAVDRALNGWDITTSKNFIEDWKNTDASLTNPKFKNWYTPDLQTTNVKWVYWVLDDIAGDSKVLWAVNRYVQDTSSVWKLLENAWEDIKSLKQKANTWADEIIQNNNRMTKKQQETFKKMSGSDEWKWMNDRWIRTQDELVDYFLESKSKVDKAMESIEWEFTSKQLTDVLDDSLDFAKKTENPDLWRLEELQVKNANWWLTMSEINEVKRFYEKNNKFNYLKEWTAEKSALATNRDSALRNWQQEIATQNWLDNLKELNKEIQASKYLTDNVTNWQSWIKWNNPISLTDWIVVSWGWLDAGWIASLVGKKVFQSNWFQDKLVDVLNYIGGREKISLPEVNTKAINQSNKLKATQKRILAEELAKVKNEQEFNAWLEKAQYMAWPALPETIQWWWVVAWQWWFITPNWPTAQELGIGNIWA